MEPENNGKIPQGSQLFDNDHCYSKEQVRDWYWFDNLRFQPCQSNCKRCTNDKDCSECAVFENPNQKLYVLNETNKDPVCVSTCKLEEDRFILGDYCLQCKESEFYVEGSDPAKCQLTCDEDGSWKDDPHRLCKRCSEGCADCLNDAVCSRCFDSSHYLQSKGGSCKAGCGEGEMKFEDEKGVKSCQKCPDNCSECNQADGCTRCENGFFLKDKNCNFCPFQCSKCKSYAECLSCKNPSHYLMPDNLRCKTDCDSNQVKLEDPKRCSSCPRNCQECTKNPAQCSKCSVGFYLTDDKKECKKCPLACSECESKRSCQACQPNIYYFYKDQDKKNVYCFSHLLFIVTLSKSQQYGLVKGAQTANSIGKGEIAKCRDPSCSQCKDDHMDCIRCRTKSENSWLTENEKITTDSYWRYYCSAKKPGYGPVKRDDGVKEQRRCQHSNIEIEEGSCAECENDLNECTKCSQGFFGPFNGVCYSSNKIPSGYGPDFERLSKGESSLKECGISGCSDCRGDFRVCRGCQQGLYRVVSEGKISACSECKSKGESIIESDCIKCSANCKKIHLTPFN